MFQPVATQDAMAVEAEVGALYRAAFPDAEPDVVRRAFGAVLPCFGGACPDYLPLDTRYHDVEHTLQGTLCLVRLLHRRHVAGAEPVVSPRLFQLGLLAILLHDTGYLKRRDDLAGTGAKYTLTHVQRSTEFAARLLAGLGYTGRDIEAVQRMIRCTGLNVKPEDLPFADATERVVGYALGTADLLGQMAAADYVDELPILFEEFAEAARYQTGDPAATGAFRSARDLMEKTPGFWAQYVWPKITVTFGGLYRFLNEPYPEGPNEYLERIAANLDRLARELAATPA